VTQEKGKISEGK